jgi:hypothetical protein
MPIQWEEVKSFSGKNGELLTVNAAMIHGRLRYNLRLGRKRDDDSLTPYIPVDFKHDDGAIRKGADPSELLRITTEAFAWIEVDAGESDKTRAEALHVRDSKRAEKAGFQDLPATQGPGHDREIKAKKKKTSDASRAVRDGMKGNSNGGGGKNKKGGGR